MNTENHSQTAAFLWSIADLLRGDFKQSQYGRIILPFTLLRRMEHLHPLLRVDRLLQDEVDVGALQLSHYRLHGLFPKRVLDTVLDAMTDHEKLSLEVLDNDTKSRAFALVILKMLKSAAGLAENGQQG